jgi:hypothetical protein
MSLGKPVLPILANIIDQSPAGKTTYPETEYGRPFTAAGFSNWFRERCDEAGLPQCSAHRTATLSMFVTESQ